MNTQRPSLRIKICGVRSCAELALLDKYGIDYAGLWWKVPKGAHNLSTQELLAVAGVECGYIKPMLVTLSLPLEVMIDTLLRTGIGAVQLHGFELPGMVARLKAAIPEVKIFKTLHVQRGQCIEQKTLIDAYRNAGVDVFIADTFLSREATGSTGVAIPEAAMEALLSATNGVATMLAGGIDAHKLGKLKESPELWGVDIDSAARVGGRIDARAVSGLVIAARPVQEDMLGSWEEPVLTMAA